MCFGANKLPGVWITFKSCFNTLNQFGEQNAFQGASFNGVFRCIYPKQTLCFRPGGNTHLPLRLTIARCWCQKILPRLSTHTHPPPPAPLWVLTHGSSDSMQMLNECVCVHVCVLNPHHSAWSTVRAKRIRPTQMVQASVLTHLLLAPELMRVDDALNDSC